MTALKFRQRTSGVDTFDTSVTAQSARLEWILEALSDPGSQRPEVAEAIAVLTAAAPGTGTSRLVGSATSTAAISERFHNVVELITGVIHELDDVSPDYLFSESLPHFVPPGWGDFLRAAAVEDPDFELPWLTDLD